MINTHEESWQAIKAFCEDMRTQSVKICVAPHTNERSADFHRGIVFAINKVLELERGEGAPKISTIPFE